MTRATVLLLVTLAASPARAAPEPLVRVRVAAKPPYFVGQQLRVDVQVLAPNFFLSPPQFPTLDVPGAIATLLDERAVNNTETIDGVAYSGITRTYGITLQQPGDVTLPAAPITFTYAAEPGQPGVSGAVTLSPRTLTATLPAGASAGGVPVPVAEVTLTQSFDRDPKTIAAGGTLTRTVDAFAPNTQAMMIPPPEVDAPAGVRIHRRDPVLTDAPGGGRRVDRVTYVFQEPGDYTLPAVELAWLDPATGTRKLSRAPAIAVSVARGAAAPAIAPSAAARGEAPSRAPRVDWRPWIAAGAGLLAVALGGVWGTRRYGAHWRAWAAARRRTRDESEAAYFARAERTCTAGDPAAAYQALGAWARRTGAASSSALAAGDPALSAEVGALERRLYGAVPETGAWDGRALAAAAAAWRRARAGVCARGSLRAPALPALNP